MKEVPELGGQCFCPFARKKGFWNWGFADLEFGFLVKSKTAARSIRQGTLALSFWRPWGKCGDQLRYSQASLWAFPPLIARRVKKASPLKGSILRRFPSPNAVGIEVGTSSAEPFPAVA